jgi:S1-C subfamily serine protease
MPEKAAFFHFYSAFCFIPREISGLGDILLGAEDQRFADIADLRGLLEGAGARQVRLEFLRGDYNRIRKVTVLLGSARRPAQAQAA